MTRDRDKVTRELARVALLLEAIETIQRADEVTSPILRLATEAREIVERVEEVLP